MTKVLVAGATLALLASAPAMAVPDNFVAKADKIVAEAWPADGPGAAVIVTEGGRIVYERGRGLADLEAKTPITPDTVFRIGSITKQFAAATLLQLAAEGRLSLDDPLSKFIPDYPQPGGGATVRQLLNHTSGIQSYTGIPGWMVEKNTDKAYSTDQLIEVFKALPSPAKPGDAWEYNNSGYILVGAIIEKVTGKPWHQAVSERILKPLDMTSFAHGTEESKVPQMAKGYMLGAEGKYRPADKIHMSVPGAAGALIGTVGDLATWANALHRGKVLPAASYRAMLTPAKLNDGSERPYGFGVELDKLRDRPTITHGGGIFGFSTSSIYIPEKDVFVAVFTNAIPPINPPERVAQKLAALAIGEPFPDFTRQPVDIATVEPVLGLYKVAGGDAERVFFARDGKLFTRRSGGSSLEVFPAGGNRFFYEDGMTWFAIRNADGGPVMEMHQQDNHIGEVARRTGPVPPPTKGVEVPRATLATYAGRYFVGGPLAVVALRDDGLTVKLGDQPTLRLIPLGEGEFSIENEDVRLVFDGPPGGPPKVMVVHQGGRTMQAPRVGD